MTRSRGKPGSKTQDVKGTGGQKGRGKKRKADSEAYKLSDYMDNQVCVHVNVNTHIHRDKYVL